MMLKHFPLTSVFAFCIGISPVFGQASTKKNPCEHVTITVTGEAKGKPDLMVLELASEATAGNAGDALSQCRSKADKACEAIVALRIQGAEVIREMYEFSSPTAGTPYGMMQSASTPAGTKASQIIKVKVRLGEAINTKTLAETISRVLDAANKAGVGFRPPPAWQAQVTGQAAASPVTYVLEDATALRMKAIDDCLAKVAQIKNALANSGMKPGKIVGIEYNQTDVTCMTNPWMAVAAGATRESASATSTSPNEITVRITLNLRFSFQELTGH